jgi:CMP-N,N'-diacetyllegionaminic acid synthase
MTGLLAIVPARAGSKGVPGKNKALVGGLPLVEYTIRALEASRAVSAIVLSTDDADLLAAYRQRDTVRLLERPANLAQDDATTASAVAHALQYWDSAGEPSPFALLLAQPTTPLRTADDIDAAFALFERMAHRPLISACKAEGIRHPDVMYRLRPDGVSGEPYSGSAEESSRRQMRETVYQRNGAIYLVTAEYFRGCGRLRSDDPVIYEMPWERSINIDVPGDFLIAKALIESGLLQERQPGR